MKLKENLDENGLIVIRTFYKNPEPDFFESVRSLYNLDELLGYFSNFNVILSRKFEKTGLDFKGISRKFFIIDLIVRKK